VKFTRLYAFSFKLGIFVFFLKKNCSKHVRVLVVCMKTKRFYFCFDNGYFNTRFVFLPHIKKNTNHKKNTWEKNLTPLGWVQLSPCGWIGPSRPSRVNDSVGQTRGTREFSPHMPAWLLFKWIIIHLNSKNAKENACTEMRRTNLET
jgi:hypothetical protein